MRMKKLETTGLCQVHNIRYYNLSPRAIDCMCYNPKNCKLALSRSDASIEIWDTSNKPYLQKVIPGTENSSIESICWANDRLFSGGLSGDITEWDLTMLRIQNHVLVTGNAVWCLDVNKTDTLIAAGTDEGYLNIYNLEGNVLLFEKILDKQEGKILCCKFDYTGKFIVSGSIDCIRVWNIDTGHVLHKMSTGRSEKFRETIVWSLYVFKDFTIASGDSRGRLVFWNGEIGAQIESNSISKADILCVSVNEDESTIFCSGIDPTVRSFTYTAIKKEEHTIYKWIKTLSKTYHLNDVKSMLCADGSLITGGIDGYLCLTPYDKFRPVHKFGPFIQNPVSISEEKRVTLFKYLNYLEIWRLGESKLSLDNLPQFDSISDGKSKEHSNNKMVLKKSTEKLLEFRAFRDETIICAAISTDGKWLCYSTKSTIRLFKVDIPTENVKPSLIKISNLPDEFSACQNILFSQNSKQIFLYKLTNQIDVFEISTGDEIDLKQTIELQKYIKNMVNIMKIDDSGKYIIVSGLCCNVCIWIKKKNGQFSHYINLPKYKFPPTSIAVRPNSSILAAVFADNKIFEYDLEELKFTFSSIVNYTTPSAVHVIDEIVFDPRNENVLILATDKFYGILDKSIKKIPNKKIKQDTEKNEIEHTHGSSDLRIIKECDHLIHLSWLNECEMIAVEVNPVALIEQLPPTLNKKMYGIC